MTRNEELLAAAAQAFATMSNPFDPAWLAEHDVTLDECGDLAEGIARAIRFYLRTPAAVRARSAVDEIVKEVFSKQP